MTVAVIAERAAELEALCVRFHVQRLDLLGSAVAGGRRKGASDLDFLVEFRLLPAGGYGDAYFGLLEGLARLFGGPVDLIVDSAAKRSRR